MEETVKTMNKTKKNSTLAANYDDINFVCNVRILTEIAVNGMNDLAKKVSDRQTEREREFPYYD